MNNNYYEILEIKKNANQVEIKKAYHQKAKKYHPDKCYPADKCSSDKERRNTDKERTEHFQQIQRAYIILSDSDKKEIYDESLGELKSNNYEIIEQRYSFVRFSPNDNLSVVYNVGIGVCQGCLGVILGTSIVIVGLVSGVTVYTGGTLFSISLLQLYMGFVPTLVLSFPIHSLFTEMSGYIMTQSFRTGLEIFSIGMHSGVKTITYVARKTIICLSYALNFIWEYARPVTKQKPLPQTKNEEVEEVWTFL